MSYTPSPAPSEFVGVVGATDSPIAEARAMRRTVRKPWLGAVLAAVLVVAAAGVYVMRAGPDSGIEFRYAFAKGSKRTYSINMTVDIIPRTADMGTPFTGSMSALMDYVVEQVNPDGSQVLSITARDVTMQPPTSNPVGEGTMRITLAPDGKITNVQGSGIFGAMGVDPGELLGTTEGPTDGASAQFLFPQFSGDPVDEGKTWSESSTFPFPIGNDKVTVTTEGRHDGYQDTRFGRAAKLHYAVKAPMNVDFTIAELFEAASKLGKSAPAGGLPPGADRARMVIQGGMDMDADSIIVPETGDLVNLEGTAKMSLTMAFSDLPPEAGSIPQVAFDATMAMNVLRVEDDASAGSA